MALSAIHLVISQRGALQMPPIASQIVDTPDVAIVSSWIQSMVVDGGVAVIPDAGALPDAGHVSHDGGLVPDAAAEPEGGAIEAGTADAALDAGVTVDAGDVDSSNLDATLSSGDADDAADEPGDCIPAAVRRDQLFSAPWEIQLWRVHTSDGSRRAPRGICTPQGAAGKQSSQGLGPLAWG